MTDTIAFISQGRLFLKQGDQPVREIESKFANDMIERHQRNAEINSWKDESVWGGGGMGFPELAQFQQAAQAGPNIAFIHVCAGPEDGHLYYVLQMDAIVGVFQYVIDEDREIRLLHRNNFFLESLSRHPTEDLYAMSIRKETGTVRLSTSEDRIRPQNHVSGGQNLDQSPRWLGDGTKRLVYQSAPIARDENGFARGIGAYAIERLDADSGNIETLIEVDDKDFLSPKVDACGQLFFIERPYKAKLDQPKPTDILRDIVYFPYRLGRTALHFLNFMSTMFVGKPIAKTLSHPSMESRHKFLTMWGRALDTQKALSRKAGSGNEPVAPKDWVLKRRSADGEESTVAEHVLCFDITNSGEVIYSDGTRVFRVEDGNPVEVLDGQLIYAVTLVP